MPLSLMTLAHLSTCACTKVLNSAWPIVSGTAPCFAKVSLSEGWLTALVISLCRISMIARRGRRQGIPAYALGRRHGRDAVEQDLDLPGEDVVTGAGRAL